jgi:hypothetical protein
MAADREGKFTWGFRRAGAKQQNSKGIPQGCISAAATGAAAALFRLGSFQNFFARSNREWALRARSSNPSIWAC